MRWYLFVLVGLPAVIVLGTLLGPGALASFDISAVSSAIAYLGAFVLMVVPGSPLFEEPGWRGFALPRLQRVHGPMIGGLILVVLWHLPRFLVPHELPPSGTVMDFVRFALALIALAYIIQWVFNNTGGRVLMAILTHATWNTFESASLVEIFPAVVGSYLNLTIGAWVLALVIIAVTRGRLGYRAEAAQVPRVR